MSHECIYQKQLGPSLTAFDSLKAWPEGRIIAHVNNKIYMASLWFYPNTSAELDDPVYNLFCRIAKLVHKRSISLLALSGIIFHFLAGGKPLVNMRWQSSNMNCLGDIIKDEKFVSYDNSKEQYNLTDSSFLPHQQIYSIIKSVDGDELQ